jgi:predicted Zn-dependent protease
MSERESPRRERGARRVERQAGRPEPGIGTGTPPEAGIGIRPGDRSAAGTSTAPREVLAARLLDLVRAVAGPESAAEVQVSSRTRSLTRFARSFIHQNVTDTSERIRLRVVLGSSWAVAETDRADADSLTRTVESAVAAARIRPADPAFPGLSPPAAVGAAGNWDDATAGASPDSRAAVVRDFVEAAGGLEAAGYVETSRTEGVYANTLGQSVAGRSTSAAADGVARSPSGAAGVARDAGVRLAELAGTDLGAVARAKAAAGPDPVDLPPGEYEVVLEPSCVADVLGFLVSYGFNGLAVVEGRSFVSVGSVQFDRAVSLWDDPLDGRSTALPYDAEGTPRRRVDLVERGTTAAVAHDRRTAAKLGASSTGHAVEGGERWGPAPPQLRLGAGPSGAAPELAAGMQRGLLVSDFWYTRVLDPKSLVITGLTRNGVWLVEDGVPTRAVRDFRFTEAYPRALGPGAVLGVGRRAVRQPDRMDGVWWEAPPLRLAAWNFTGGASG